MSSQTKIYKAIILLLLLPIAFAYEPATDINLFSIEKCIGSVIVIVRGYNTSINNEYQLKNCKLVEDMPKKDTWDCNCQKNITMLTEPYVAGQYYVRAQWEVAINDTRADTKSFEVKHIPKKEEPRTINTTGIVGFLIFFGIVAIAGLVFLIKKIFFKDDDKLDKLDDKEVIELIGKL